MSIVSVLMPAFNCEKYVAASINSILNQTFSDFELIIVEDGSTDNTHGVISSFSDKRIKYYRNESNRGLAFTRNRLLQLATCSYLAFLDSDDIAEKDRIEIEYNVLSSKNISLVSSSARSLDEKGNLDHADWKFELDPDQLKAHLLFYNPVITSTVMFKKEMLPAETFREEYPPCEDYDLWVRMLLHNKGMVLPDFLATYRLYDNSVSKMKAADAINNRNKIITDQLDYYFKNEYSAEEALIHLSLTDFTLKNSAQDMPAIKDWIEKLITLNRNHNHFNEQILKQVLYERILKKFLRLRDYKFSVFQTLMNFKKELNPVSTFKMQLKVVVIFFYSLFK